MIMLFSSTFKGPYFEYLVNTLTQYYTKIVIITNKIKQAVRTGKISNISKAN